MKFIISALALAGLAAADMQIFAGNTNDPYGGGTGMQLYFVEGGVQANCDNLGSPTILRSDASDFGAACDGCTADQPNDWNISRLEMKDENNEFTGAGAVTQEEYGSLTAYGEGGGSYGLNARDGDVETRIGTCQRVMGEWQSCFRGLTTDEFIPIMNCYGPLTPV